MRIIAILIASALLFAACSSGNDASPLQAIAEGINAMPSCEAWSGEAVTADTLERGCRDGSTIMLTATKVCEDERTIFWNDVGWGYFGEPMQLHDDGPPPKTPPSDEYSRCIGLP